VPLSLFFALWFPSAIGMMYWDFPAVSAHDRLVRALPIDPGSLSLSLSDALAKLSGSTPEEVRLNTFDGRPVYRIWLGPAERVVYADTGEVRPAATPQLMRRVAAQWAQRPETDGRADAVIAVDQWTVQGPLRSLRPLWKFSFSDAQEVYVAEATGEVVQYTTRASRLAAYLGPIPHWLYFTPLRRHQQAWTAAVVWSSGIATIGAALGLIVGIWMSAPTARIPYRGQKRWHTALGLCFGVGAVTWAFSGMLSMDPFPGRDESAPAARVRDPLTLARFAARDARDAIEALAPRGVKQLEWVSVLGEAAYLATLEDGTTRVVPMIGPPKIAFDRQRIAAALTSSGAIVALLDRYDAYYRDRRHLKPLPVLRVRQLLDSGEPADSYVDPATAQVVATYSDRDWTKRWLYHGLHSLDFPWLYERRPLWDAVVIAFMIGGTALSVTSLMLAWRVARAGARPPSVL
jgi:hypothetical protein